MSDEQSAGGADETASEDEPRYQPLARPRTILIWVIVAAVVIGGSLIGLGYLVS